MSEKAEKQRSQPKNVTSENELDSSLNQNAEIEQHIRKIANELKSLPPEQKAALIRLLKDG